MNNICSTPSRPPQFLDDLADLSSDLLKVVVVLKVCSFAIKGLSYMTDIENKTDKKLDGKKVVQESSSGFHFYDLLGLIHLL